ncbi:hypothetical protein KY343_02255 [Candidatus Woesearchaeota archaeon]|nr:hypothetical protein [Candidatus Woesearchaeota archaeon]
MYTKDIELSDITNWDARPVRDKLYAFRQLEKCWGKDRKVSGPDMCSKITKPISFEINSIDDYVNAFHFLLQHEFAYELAVRKPKNGEEENETKDKTPENIGNQETEDKTGWEIVKITPFGVRNFSAFLEEYGELIKTMAKLAYEDKIKDNYIRLKFRKWDEESMRHKGPPAKIEFREHDGRLIGYQCTIPYQLEGIFKLTKNKKARKYRMNHGMWVPNGYKPIKKKKDKGLPKEEPSKNKDPLWLALFGDK